VTVTDARRARVCPGQRTPTQFTVKSQVGPRLPAECYSAAESDVEPSGYAARWLDQNRGTNTQVSICRPRLGPVTTGTVTVPGALGPPRRPGRQCPGPAALRPPLPGSQGPAVVRANLKPRPPGLECPGTVLLSTVFTGKSA
jgi:hypothetical protein